MAKKKIGFMSDEFDSPGQEEESKIDPALMFAITHVINNYTRVQTLQESDFISNENLTEELVGLTGGKINRFDFITAMESEGYQYEHVDGKGIVWLLKNK